MNRNHKIGAGLWFVIGCWVFAGFHVSLPARSESLEPIADVVAVEGGSSHSCILSAAGALRCFGFNGNGQLGDGTRLDRFVPTAVSGLVAGVAQVSTGGQHTCAVHVDGSLYCWGRNHLGQLGDGSSTNRTAPVPVQGLDGPARYVAAGDAHTCVATDSAAVWCWGDNSRGQLGDGTTTARALPSRVGALSGGVTQLAAGLFHSCARTANGAVHCWGGNDRGQVGDGSTADRALPVVVVLALSALEVDVGGQHSCARLQDGSLSCWGSNSNGQLGDGSVSNRPSPVAVTALVEPVVSFAAGGDHNCAALASGQVRCWGSNLNGQLGDGTGNASRVPVPVDSLEGPTVLVGAGQFHSCALGGAGTLQCWGYNLFGQLGDGSGTPRVSPRPIANIPDDAIFMSGGLNHSCAFGVGGAVHCWGDNAEGQIGDGTASPRTVPKAVTGLGGGVVQLSSGRFHNCVLAAGAPKCWGSNARGQLGDGTTTRRRTPVDVQGLDTPLRSLAAGGLHTCALSSAGSVSCFGGNDEGQLGDGSTTQRLAPVAVAAIPGPVLELVSGFLHSCALTTDGRVFCWGANSDGQLADGTTTSRSTPVPVSALGSGVRAITAGFWHTCALTSSERVFCWGRNAGGQLGDGTRSNRTSATRVLNMDEPVAEVAAGGVHTCALLRTGEARCWGENLSGQIGDGSLRLRTTPVRVSGLGGGTLSVFSAYKHNCARTSEAMQCWGNDQFGQIGDGGRDYTLPSPVLVPVIATSAGTNGNEASSSVASDETGKITVFESTASNLVDGDSNNASDIFLRNSATGALIRVSVDNANRQIDGPSLEASTTRDGELVVFVSSNAGIGKVWGEPEYVTRKIAKGNSWGIFLRNMLTGTTQRVGTAMPGGSGTNPNVSANGLAVVWSQMNEDPAAGVMGQANVFRAGLSRIGSEVAVEAPTCLSCTAPGKSVKGSKVADGVSTNPVVSADGLQVAFQTTARNLDPADNSPCSGTQTQINLANVLTGSVSRVVPPPGSVACGGAGAVNPSISYSGDQLAFQSDAALTSNTATGFSNVFVFDNSSREVVLVSKSEFGHAGLGNSSDPAISGDGSVVAFRSEAKNLDPSAPDDNELDDIYVAVLNSQTGTVQSQLATRNERGDQTNQSSTLPALNYDGTVVSFESTATNLVVNQLTGVPVIAAPVGNIIQVSGLDVGLARSATWWRGSETGWGLSVVDQGDVHAAAWFTYGENRQPIWLLSALRPKPNGGFGGDLLKFRGHPFNRSPGEVVLDVEVVGELTVFYSLDGLLMDYTYRGTSQNKRLTRFPFGEKSLRCRQTGGSSGDGGPNFSDVWWGGVNNSGWGLFVTHIDDDLYAIWYTYDSASDPTFYTLVTRRSAANTFTGEIHAQDPGTPLLDINGQPAGPTSRIVGTATLEYTDGDRGQFSWRIGGISDSREITRFQFGSDSNECEAVSSG